MMVTCWFCGTEMKWEGDSKFDECGIEGEGIVASLSCTNKKCNSTADFYSGEENE